jgi:multidrug transporter EmrE-like cation transporter
MQWFTLAVAVVSNVIANLAFKKAMMHLRGETAIVSISLALRQPWLWVGMAAALLLLASYILALRHFHVSFAYSTVTGLALALMTILSAYLFGDRLGGLQIAGIAFVMLGVLLLSIHAST